VRAISEAVEKTFSTASVANVANKKRSGEEKVMKTVWTTGLMTLTVLAGRALAGEIAHFSVGWDPRLLKARMVRVPRSGFERIRRGRDGIWAT
jgi:hypothetical protein